MNIPKKMNATVRYEFDRPLQIEEIDVKLPEANQVLIKVVACGVCHTYLRTYMGADARYEKWYTGG